jgi:hypothetical protein
MLFEIVPEVSNFRSEDPLDCVIVPVPAAALLPMTSVPVLSVVPPL